MFTTLKAGRYTICMKNSKYDPNDIPEIRLRLDEGVQALEQTKDPLEGVSTKDDLLPVEQSLNRTEELTQQIHRDMNDMRRTGSEQQLLGESISTTVVLLGCLSVGIVVGSAALQVWYLKSFFKQRKLL